MRDDLKACPFCGGEAEQDIYGMAYCPDGLSGADNENKKCYNDAILSVVDWNTRPIEDRKSREITELRDECLTESAEIERLKLALTDALCLIEEHPILRAHATRYSVIASALRRIL